MLTIILALLYRLGVLSIVYLQEAELADFNDLGKLLLGGFAAALVVAIGFTLLKRKLQIKNPPPPSFISIASLPKTGNDKPSSSIPGS